MTALSAEAVAAAAYAGGFRGNDIIDAVAVAYAESSWDPNNKNSCCHGLWQINIGAHPGMSANVYDPIQNAKYAYTIFRAAGNKWCATGKPPNGCNPWQGYGNSNYKSARPKAIEGYMSAMTKINNGQTPQSIVGSNTPSIPGGLPSPGEAASSLAGITPFVTTINRIGHWITDPDNLMRIFKVLTGGVVIIVGAAIMMDKQIMSVVPAGRIAKAAKGAVSK